MEDPDRQGDGEKGNTSLRLIQVAFSLNRPPRKGMPFFTLRFPSADKCPDSKNLYKFPRDGGLHGKIGVFGSLQQ